VFNRTRLRGAACFLVTCLSVAAIVTLLSAHELGSTGSSVPNARPIAPTHTAEPFAEVANSQTPPASSQPSVPEGPERPERAERVADVTDPVFEQDERAHDHPALPPQLTERPPTSDLDVVTEGSLALVIELAPTGARVVEVVKKDVPFRVINAKGGDYHYEVEDAAGTVLHQGQFEVAALCPLQGAEHTDDHQLGHIVLGHEASILIRIPDATNAQAVVLTRQLPDFDVAPRFLGRLDL
jgi:hypothetical protein